MTDAALLSPAVFLVAGAGLGLLYFALVQRTARLLAAGGAGLRIVALYAVRIVLAAGLFWQAAQAGALPLLAALLGFLAGRVVVMRRAEPAE